MLSQLKPIETQNRPGAFPSAGSLNLLSAAVRGVRGEGGLMVRIGADGGLIFTGGGAGNATSFDYELSDTTLTIDAGWFIIHGRADIEVVAAELTLDGSEAWIYVHHERGSTAATTRLMNSMPASTANVIRVRLYKFTNTGSSWTLERRLHWGDINLGAPMP